VEVDAGAAGAARGGWDGDVHGTVDWAQELPEDRGGYMAQSSAGSAGENGSHEAAVETQAGMTDGVDAAVDAVKLAIGDSTPDRPRAQTSRFKLPPRYRAMLTPGDSRHLSIGRVEFLTHVGT
jgi:hypothetical protein